MKFSSKLGSGRSDKGGMKSSVPTLDESGKEALLVEVVQHVEDVTLQTRHRYQLGSVVTGNLQQYSLGIAVIFFFVSHLVILLRRYE